MNIFRSIVFTAVIAGLCAGLFVSVLNAFGTTPLILQAETYESAGGDGHSHDHGQAATTEQGHQHDEDAWAPSDGFERTFFTSAANVLTGIGYGLVLAGIFMLRGKPVTWREGLFFGLGGFACFMLAPLLGLPPELPGTPAADLASRQIWWVSTAASTAAGLGLLAFVKQPWAAVVGLMLLAAPHIVGAPLPPEGQHALAPEMLEKRFVALAAVSSLAFWSVLGVVTAIFFTRSLSKEA